MLSLTVQNKQETHEQPSLNKKQPWIIQVTTYSIKNQGFTNLWMGLI